MCVASCIVRNAVITAWLSQEHKTKAKLLILVVVSWFMGHLGLSPEALLSLIVCLARSSGLCIGFENRTSILFTRYHDDDADLPNHVLVV